MTKYVFEATEMFGNRPAGFLGFYTSRARARVATFGKTRRIRRVRVSLEFYSRILAGEETNA